MSRFREITIAALEVRSLLSRHPEHGANPGAIRFMTAYLKIFHEEALDNLIKCGNDRTDYFRGQLQLIENMSNQLELAHESYLAAMRDKERLQI